MSAHRAVVVEDHDDIRDLLAITLRQSDIEVLPATTGAEALEIVRREDPDLVTLDLSLPDMDGVEVCRAIREFSDAYIVMITGRSDEIDRLVGLEVGADDYLSKPFSPREVKARCLALLRRPRLGAVAAAAPSAPPAPAAPVAGTPEPAGPAPLTIGPGLVLEPVQRVAVLHGRPLPLTPSEVELLTVLASRPGHNWSRGDLVRAVWDTDFIESDFLVDITVGNLRRKLREAGGRQEWIRTVGGSTYCYEAS